MDNIFEGLSEEALFQLLPGNVRTNITKLETAGLDFDQIGALLSNAPNSGIALKGGNAPFQNLWQSIKLEFKEFLCGSSEKYADLKSGWKSLQEKSSTFGVSTLSVLIGAKLGVASGIVAPMVILLLVTCLRIGKEALCKTL